jgi:DNA-binding response OmpR family regulator
MNALIVERSKTMRHVLHRLLSAKGFAVSEAEDGRHALDILQSAGPADIVLVDWVPRETSCLEFITCLREAAACDALIILLAEADPGIRELQSAILAGADDYLTKPFTSRQIDETLARAGLNGQSGELPDTHGHPCRY